MSRKIVPCTYISQEPLTSILDCYSWGKGLEFKPIFANLIGCSFLLTELNVSVVHRYSGKFNYYSYY